MVKNKKVPTVFVFGANEVRIELDTVGTVWFNANDVCSILGYTNPRKALADHVKDTYVTKRYIGVVTGKKPDGTNITQQVNQNFINEFGIYELILSSKKQEAEKFKQWVVEDVIPTISRTGTYNIRDSEWLKTRAEGKESRRKLTDSIDNTEYLTDMGVARATNVVYKATTGHKASDLKEILETDSVRDALPKLTLWTISAIESFASVALACEQIESTNDYVNLVAEVADMQITFLENKYKIKEKIMVKDTRQELVGSKPTYPPTELLKRFDLGISVVKFNKLMRSSGKLEVRQRPSTSKPGEFKDYEALVDTNYGINEQKFKSGKLVGYQVKYFEDTFVDLISTLKTL